eukprot:17487-Heterococcus_DN1.PRE.3
MIARASAVAVIAADRSSSALSSRSSDKSSSSNIPEAASDHEQVYMHTAAADISTITAQHNVAPVRVESSASDDLLQLFHVLWLNVHNIEALVSDPQVPQVHSQVICAQEVLPIAVRVDAVDVVGVRIAE